MGLSNELLLCDDSSRSTFSVEVKQLLDTADLQPLSTLKLHTVYFYPSPTRSVCEDTLVGECVS